MRAVHFECNMGAAGDMLCAALYELIEDKRGFLDRMNSLGLPGVAVSAEPAASCGITGTRYRVSVNGAEEHEHHHDHGHEHHEHGHEHHEHHHAAAGDIYALIDGLELPERVRDNARGVYALIAEAESRAHGRPVELVHFHEVGALDAVADVVGFCLLMDMLGAESVTASPVTTGSGSVMTAHGLLPVPAPATAFLLEGIPTRAGDVECELCTPTGAALLKRFCTSFGARPEMTAAAVGYGMGSKTFEKRPNCVRAFLGETAADGGERLCELRCSVDDMTPEAASFAAEMIMGACALDMYIEQVLMKKGRPGFVFVCLCREEDAERFTDMLLRHTTTLGVRRFGCVRAALSRVRETRDTPYGSVRVKASSGRGASRVKAEYEDVAALAREKNISFAEAEKILKDWIN